LKSDLWAGKRYARFKDEIEGMRRCDGIPGVIPLLQFNAPEKPTYDDPPWIVMGFAERLTDALGKSATLEQVVKAFLEIGEALATMHARGLAHRDIKPDNLFRFQGGWAVGDLGLIDFEGKAPITAEGEKLGPAFYIAPEMLNNSTTADGKKADVYSFTKALWVLATGQRFPPPGEQKRTDNALTVSAYVNDLRARLLDALVEAATAFDPAARPTMEVIVRELQAWVAPTAPSASGDELDLSAFASELQAINSAHYVRDRQIRERNEFITREGERIRELFRLATQSIAEALEKGNFINPRASIDNLAWGFRASGLVLATAWRGEVGLKLEGWISVDLSGRAEVTCGYVAEVAEDGKCTDWKLWTSNAVFLLGGSEEQQEVERLISEIRAQFRGCVERVLRMSRGEEGAPPRALG
jgi:serine/threonine protein kinase